jgi:hypothetical protein
MSKIMAVYVSESLIFFKVGELIISALYTNTKNFRSNTITFVE